MFCLSPQELMDLQNQHVPLSPGSNQPQGGSPVGSTPFHRGTFSRLLSQSEFVCVYHPVVSSELLFVLNVLMDDHVSSS